MLVIEKDKKTKVAIVCPVLKNNSKGLSGDDLCCQQSEAQGLVLAMGQAIVFVESICLAKFSAATYFGKGVIERLKQKCEENSVELLVVDGTLSPVQQRNLEKALHLKVIDRTAVILEIFGQRAQTKEGKLQVELAHLTYQRGRLVRSWTHLERQRGGGGFLGGPGEKQVELDRRLLDERILKIKHELDKVKRTRSIQRSARVKVPYPVVALVGYTNAGKSTLFNYLTKADVFAKDMLFATLDPTMRKLDLDGIEVILSDTVGFISDLPHELIMSFRATLEEVLAADLILHVIDVSNLHYKEQREDVLNVLHELGLENIESSAKYLEVYNKTDLLEKKFNDKKGVAVSALSGQGVDALLVKIKKFFYKKTKVREVVVPVSDGKTLAQVYQTAEVMDRYEDEKNIYLRVRSFQ